MSHNLMHPTKLSRRSKIIINESASLCIHMSRKSTLMGRETQADTQYEFAPGCYGFKRNTVLKILVSA